MRIELNYTQEELSTLLDGLNNAIIAVNNVYNALKLGCTVPKEFAVFEEYSFDEIDNLAYFRLSALKDLYQYLLRFED